MSESKPNASNVFGSSDDDDNAPMFRVVEIVRDERGRLRQEGKVWNTDLQLMRKFGRALASNTASHRVVVADAAGNVLEEIPIVSATQRDSRWGDWQDIALPPMPPRAKNASLLPKPRSKRIEPQRSLPAPATVDVPTMDSALDAAAASLRVAAQKAVPAPPSPGESDSAGTN